MSFTDIFERYGYDPDDIVQDRDIPERLLEDLELDQDEDE